MKTCGSYQKGQMIQIINDEHPLYGEMGEIDSYNMYGQYLVKLAGGNWISIFPFEIGPWLGEKMEQELYRAQLLQLQLLAIDHHDRQWFEDLRAILRQLEDVT